MSIIWNDDLRTGINVIDEQHECFIEKMNKIQELKSVKEGLYQLLLDLEVYCSVHFRTEEDYMISCDYPDYDLHKKSHDNALLNYKTFLDQSVGDHVMEEIATALIDYIECWFKDHYSNDDIKMAAFLKQNKFKTS